MKPLINEGCYVSVNTHVKSKIYLEFTHSISNERRHIEQNDSKYEGMWILLQLSSDAFPMLHTIFSLANARNKIFIQKSPHVNISNINEGCNVSVNTHVKSKIYLEFTHSISNERRHIRKIFIQKSPHVNISNIL
jgi:predicted DNA-binding antitoxin AbrB/MazE fold protein